MTRTPRGSSTAKQPDPGAKAPRASRAGAVTVSTARKTKARTALDVAEVETGKRSKGRPRLVIGPDDIKEIRTYAAIGLTMAEIASLLGVSAGTFSAWQANPDVYEAVQKGRTQALALVGKALFDKAKAGDLGSIVWFEKTRGKRSDRVVVVNEDEASRITRQIKGLSVDQLRRLADGEHPESVMGGDA